ncbi:MAG: TIGR00153 family protein [Polyangiales bacterium]|nr:TIGR00153 family protein [Myxococcales bacterium]
MQLPLAKLFARSPLKSVVQQMDAVVECAHAVGPLLDALVAGDQGQVTTAAKVISKLEGAADDAKNEFRAHMPHRLMLPVARRDVLRLVSQIDAIADSAEDLAVLLTMRKMDVPDGMKAPLLLFRDRVLTCVHTARELVHMLDDLLAAGFRGHAAEAAHALIERLAREEHDTDKLQDQLAKIVMQLENDMAPVAVMMWLKILKELGDMANHAENVGDQFRLFLAR